MFEIKKKIRITFCMYRIITGGIEICLMRILKTLVKNPLFKITIVTRLPVEEERFKNFFKENNIELKIYPQKPVKSEYRGLNIINYKIKKHSRKHFFEKSDLIIDYFNAGYINELKNIKAPKIAFLHIGSKCGIYKIKTNKDNLLNTYDKIVCLTDLFKNAIIKEYPAFKDKLIRIYNPIDIDDITSKASEKNDIKGKYFTFVGRMDVDKDHKTVITAFKTFVENNADGKLYLLGDGPLRSSYEDMVKQLSLEKNIIFLGTVENPLQYVKNAKANILSSPSEGLPTVLLEAQCLHTLCIAADCPDGPREILMDGQSGILFPMENSAKLSEILDNVWNDRIDTKQLIETADKNLTRFNYDAILKELINLFTQTTQKTKNKKHRPISYRIWHHYQKKYGTINTNNNEVAFQNKKDIESIKKVLVEVNLLLNFPELRDTIIKNIDNSSYIENEVFNFFNILVWRQTEISFPQLADIFERQLSLSINRWSFFEKYIAFLIMHGDLLNNLHNIFAENETNISLWTRRTLLYYISFCIYNKNKVKATELLEQYIKKYGYVDINGFLPIAALLCKQNQTLPANLKHSANLWNLFDKQMTSFTKMIKGKRVALVGNGPQEIGTGHGAKIDSYDIVIRMNKYKISEETIADYGKKVTIWVNCEHIPNNLSYKGNFQMMIWLCNFYAAPWYNLVCNSDTLEANKNILSFDMISIWREVYEKTGIYCPSNGLNLIYLIKKINPYFSADDCFGFSFKEKKLSKNPEWKHYAGEKLFNMPHDLFREQKAIYDILENERK